MGTSTKSHFREYTTSVDLDCGLILPCSLHDYNTKSVTIYLASDNSPFHKPYDLESWFPVERKKPSLCIIAATMSRTNCMVQHMLTL